MVRVNDTGRRAPAAGDGLGTGLATLRERLQLVFGGDAHLQLGALRAARRVRRTRLPCRELASMTRVDPTALIADDEPLLRDELARLLAERVA